MVALVGASAAPASVGAAGAWLGLLPLLLVLYQGGRLSCNDIRAVVRFRWCVLPCWACGCFCGCLLAVAASGVLSLGLLLRVWAVLLVGAGVAVIYPYISA